MSYPRAVSETAGHIILTAKITELPENAVLREATNALSKRTRCDSGAPAIRDIENGVELTFSEKPRFCFEIGSDQRSGSTTATAATATTAWDSRTGGML